MGTASSYSFAFGPLVAMVVVGVLALVLRWVAPGRPSRPKPAKVKAPATVPAAPTQRREEYGLLMPAATLPDDDAAERARRQLDAHGIRATVAQTAAGPQVMVFLEDLPRAQAVLR